MDRTEFVLHVSDTSEIINVEASTCPTLPQAEGAKAIFDLGVREMFSEVTHCGFDFLNRFIKM